jgi:hypothetical protein
MALTDEDKAFLIKIGQELPKEVKETKKERNTRRNTDTRNRGITQWQFFYSNGVVVTVLDSVDLSQITLLAQLLTAYLMNLK